MKKTLSILVLCATLLLTLTCNYEMIPDEIVKPRPTKFNIVEDVGNGGFEDKLESVIVTDDNFYILFGRTDPQITTGYIKKVDTLGAEIWNYSSSALITNQAITIKAATTAIEGGGFYVAAGTSGGGGTRDFNLIKIRDAGNNVSGQFYNTYPPSSNDTDDILESIIATSDGYLLIGHSRNVTTSKFNGYVIKVDQDGVFEWEGEYGGNGQDFFYDGVATDDGYMLVGRTTTGSVGSSDIYLVKIDNNGTMFPQQPPISGKEGEDIAFAILATDTGFITAGWITQTNADGRDIHLRKIDVNGNFQWESIIDDQVIMGENAAYDIASAVDGGFVLAGYTQQAVNTDNRDVYLVKVNSMGQLEWQQTYSRLEDDEARDIEVTKDCGYIIVGQSNVTSSSDSGDLYFIKTDAEGNDN